MNILESSTPNKYCITEDLWGDPPTKRCASEKMKKFEGGFLLPAYCKLCDKCRLFWAGTAPFCQATCSDFPGAELMPMEHVSTCGDGKCCWTSGK